MSEKAEKLRLLAAKAREEALMRRDPRYKNIMLELAKTYEDVANTIEEVEATRKKYNL